MVCKDILRGRYFPWDSNLQKFDDMKRKVFFIIINYSSYAIFLDVCKILEGIHVVLLFLDFAMICFRFIKSLRNGLIRSQFSNTDDTGRSMLRGGNKSYNFWTIMKYTWTFES